MVLRSDFRLQYGIYNDSEDLLGTSCQSMVSGPLLPLCGSVKYRLETSSVSHYGVEWQRISACMIV